MKTTVTNYNFSDWRNEKLVGQITVVRKEQKRLLREKWNQDTDEGIKLIDIALAEMSKFETALLLELNKRNPKPRK
jgi:hypothetical protein